MNPDRLLAHFDHLVDTSDAIGRLRRFILDLAVRGKLVEQDSEDKPAAELLKRIEVEKNQRIETDELRKQKLQTLDEKQIPFVIPTNWTWTQLAQIGIINPKNDTEDSIEASFVPMPMIFAEYGRANQHEVRSWAEIKKGFTHFAEGDVGLAKITPCFENGKSTVFRNLTGGLGAGTTELHIVRLILVIADYILIFLKSPYFIETGIPKMTGTAGQKRVPRDYFAFSPFPLPPLTEQHQIVAKVDELMTLCDELEAARAKREIRRDRLVAATLHGLNNGDASSESDTRLTFEESARFYFKHLPRLTTRPEHIKQLRQTILNLAVRGKLVENDPEDELLKEVGLVELSEDEIPFDIPENWRWTRFKNLGQMRGGGTPSKGIAEFWGGDIPWVSPKDMKRDYIDSALQNITPKALDESSVKLIEQGSILFVVRGMILAHSFPVALTKVPLTVNQDMKALTLNIPAIVEFVLRALKGLRGEILSKVQRSSHGTHRLESYHYYSLLFPLPPLTEQHRIVAKVDELMVLCDELEAQLTTTASARRQLLEAALHEALSV